MGMVGTRVRLRAATTDATVRTPEARAVACTKGGRR
mgnify:CR=1 FL=1